MGKENRAMCTYSDDSQIPVTVTMGFHLWSPNNSLSKLHCGIKLARGACLMLLTAGIWPEVSCFRGKVGQAGELVSDLCEFILQGPWDIWSMVSPSTPPRSKEPGHLRFTKPACTVCLFSPSRWCVPPTTAGSEFENQGWLRWHFWRDAF